MRAHIRQTDGFATCCGLGAIAAGPTLLARGAPAGWSFLLIGTGLILLLTQWVIAAEIHFEISNRAQLLVAFAGLTCVAIAVVYLTRAANDLPSLFPGHDRDSEQFRIVHGIVTLTVGLVLFGRGLASTHPARGRP